MIIDTSAIMAILFGESEAMHYEQTIAATWPRRMSAVALLEATMVIEGRGGTAAGRQLDMFLDKAEIELVPVTPEHVEVARRAAAVRQGQSSGGVELRRLSRLRAREGHRRAAAVQGGRLHPHRRRTGVTPGVNPATRRGDGSPARPRTRAPRP